MSRNPNKTLRISAVTCSEISYHPTSFLGLFQLAFLDILSILPVPLMSGDFERCITALSVLQILSGDFILLQIPLKPPL